MKKNSFGVAAAFVTLALFGGATTAVGCGGPSTSSLCAEFCACRSCTSNDQQACEVAGEEASDEADEAGCSSEFDDVVTCALAKVTCNDDKPSLKGCEAEQSALARCPSRVNPLLKTDCQKAEERVAAKLGVCGVAVTTTPTDPMSCSATQGTLLLCSATCVNAASCDFLKCSIGNDMAACSAMKEVDSKAFGDCSSACSPSSN
jgi:hypothetical protein